MGTDKKSSAVRDATAEHGADLVVLAHGIAQRERAFLHPGDQRFRAVRQMPAEHPEARPYEAFDDIGVAQRATDLDKLAGHQTPDDVVHDAAAALEISEQRRRGSAAA